MFPLMRSVINTLRRDSVKIVENMILRKLSKLFANYKPLVAKYIKQCVEKKKAFEEKRLGDVKERQQEARPGLQVICRLCSSTTKQTEGEQRIANLLKTKFPKATHVEVADISGGCGSMYEVLLESEEFKGHRTVAQHRMVNEALKHELEDMHGLRISTRVPKDS